ncbi:MAG: hypothetical protein ACK5LV_08230 [Lachnospirales bacterium]
MSNGYYYVNGKRNYKFMIILFCLFMLIALFMKQAMPNTVNYTPDDPAGFLSGIWHGWIAPLSLVFSFFGDSGIYAVNNSGFLYDFGFYMAIVSGFGGLSFTRNKFKGATVHTYTSSNLGGNYGGGYRDPNEVSEQ